MTTSLKTTSEKLLLLASASFIIFFIGQVIHANGLHNNTSTVAATTTEHNDTEMNTTNSELSQKPAEPMPANEITKKSADTSLPLPTTEEASLNSDNPKEAMDYEFVYENDTSAPQETKKTNVEDSSKTMPSDQVEPIENQTSETIAIKEEEPIINSDQTQPAENAMPDKTVILSKSPQTPTEQAKDISQVPAVDNNPQIIHSAYTKMRLTNDNNIKTCSMKQWGVEFKCNVAWETTKANDSGDSAIVLSKDPLVTLNLNTLDKKIRYLAQLNKFFFEDSNLYKDGFITENVNFAGHPAVYVKGFDKHVPGTQRRDYFFLNDSQLINISFAFAEDKQQEGKAIVSEVKNTFAPIAP